MTKPDFTEENIQSLKECHTKAMKFWLEKNRIDKSRIEMKTSVNQTKLNTEVFIYYIINPEKKE